MQAEVKERKFNDNMQAYKVNMQAGRIKILWKIELLSVDKKNYNVMEQFEYRIRFQSIKIHKSIIV